MENRGYFYYEIKKGDSVYKLSNEFGTSVQRIIYANPNINMYNLKIGSKIIIPVGNITDINEYYNSTKLLNDINSLKVVYPFI